MKILTQLTESANIRSLTNAANKLIELKVSQDHLTALSDFLSAQRFAGYMGLRKLVEKDYSPGEEPVLINLTNT
jgi:hypothetical protein